MLKRIAGWGVVVSVLAGLCVFMFSRGTRAKTTFQLPNGTEVRFLQVTTSTNQNVFIWGKPYQRLLFKLLPSRWKHFSKVYMTWAPGPYTNVFWFHVAQPSIRSSPGDTFPSRQFRLLDEFGCVYDAQVNMSGSTSEGSLGSASSELFGPHGKIVGLCLYDDPDREHEIGRMYVPGCSPEPAKHSAGNPAKVRQGSIELVSLQTGLKDGRNAFSRAIFHAPDVSLMFPNSPLAFRVSISDSHGRPNPRSTGLFCLKDGELIYNFTPALNPADGPFTVHVNARYNFENVQATVWTDGTANK